MSDRTCILVKSTCLIIPPSHVPQSADFAMLDHLSPGAHLSNAIGIIILALSRSATRLKNEPIWAHIMWRPELSAMKRPNRVKLRFILEVEPNLYLTHLLKVPDTANPPRHRSI